MEAVNPVEPVKFRLLVTNLSLAVTYEFIKQNFEALDATIDKIEKKDTYQDVYLSFNSIEDRESTISL